MGNAESVPQTNPKLVKKVIKKRVNDNSNEIRYPENIRSVQYPQVQTNMNQNRYQQQQQQIQYNNHPLNNVYRQPQQNQYYNQQPNMMSNQHQMMENMHNSYRNDPKVNNQPMRNMNDMMMERNRLNIVQQEDQYKKPMVPIQPRPENTSTQLMRREIKELNLTPYSFQDEIDEYQKQQDDERRVFEEEERKRRSEFDEYMNRKTDYLKKEIKKFEDNYDPWEILGLRRNEMGDKEIKKAYKKMALKYHPDKAGPQYQNQFQLITQAYIYLLNKVDENKQYEDRFTQKVEQRKYRDDMNEEGVENIYINKDKFDINQFNNIFEKYHINENEDGYGYMYQQKDTELIDDSKVFGTSFNKEIFNAHFDDIKKTRKSTTDMIEYQEPESLISVSKNIGFRTLGEKVEDYSGNGYTDYRKAHVEENLLIDPNSVKYREYKNVDQLKSHREQISFNPSQEDTIRQQTYERLRQEKERKRLEQLDQYDRMWEEQYNRINKKLLIHK